MPNSILIIAFHFPPIASSSGMQRATKVVRYLTEDGWDPVVLTVSPRAYGNTNPSQLREIPDGVPVCRAFGLDATRHFAIKGRYLDFLAWPDPWASWIPFATMAGKRLIKRYKPKIIWSTFPITSSNVVACRLAEWSKLPWISDLRDPITLDGYPVDPTRYKQAVAIEKKTIKHASKVVFTAEHTRQIYLGRYPELEGRAELIPNGYDEANFPQLTEEAMKSDKRLFLLHSGAMQPKGRNPGTFFAALRKLKERGVVSAEKLRVVFRASGFDGQYRGMAEEAGVDDIVTLEPHLPYEKAIREMVSADGLLVFQGTIYNHAMPAKVYEYLYARRPMLGIVDKAGETNHALGEMGITATADIADPDEIADKLEEFLTELGNGSYSLPSDSIVKKYSRRSQVMVLSQLLRQASAV
ncbi:MAG: glycosyltransferase [Pseudomonadota bacterium]